MLKKINIFVILAFLFGQSATARETKTFTHTNRILTKVLVNGVEKSRCPEGGKSCITTVTIEDDGTFHHTLKEGDLIGNPDPEVPTVNLDPTGYTESNNIDIILDLVSEDLINGEGVTILP